MEKEVRVRFAPSPTGPLHIGGVRTALFNYLFARHNGGKMILRIEDTDQTRFVAGAEDYIKESLEWCGITLDESPWNPNADFGPYRQSERKPMYMEYAQKLVDNGHAYYAFDTPEELDEMREKLKAARVATPQYNAITRMTMKNSLILPADEVKARIDAGDPYVIRLKVPRKEEIRLNDMVRGWVMVHSHTIDDKVIMKSDGMPTYHLANVVDDHLMEITHVIRGEEWLPSAPLHVLLYKYLGWEDEMPRFAHLPLILKPDGNGKLSKRDGDKMGFSVFPLEWKDPESGAISTGYREDGFLPSAFINFLSFLGWSPGNNEEMFSFEQLIEAFTIERVGKSGTKFDIEKARWYNQQYIKAESSEELAKYFIASAEANGKSCSAELAAQICDLLRDRVTYPQDFWNEGKIFFEDPAQYDEKVVRKKWNETTVSGLKAFAEKVDGIAEFKGDDIKATLSETLASLEIPMGKVMQPLRVALTGMGAGPELMVVVELLGKEEVKRRLNLAFEKLPLN